MQTLPLRARAIAAQATALAAVLLFAAACGGQAQLPDSGTRTIQPGAPGQDNRTLTAEEVARTLPQHTEADVRFMQGMMLHHAQAIVMTNMVAERTGNQQIRLLARRIELSQDDEIKLMRYWLEDRGESVPAMYDEDGHEGHDAHAGHDGGAGHDAHAGHAGHAGHVGQQTEGAGHAADDHEGMHGMLSAEELDRLAASSGADFDRLFLEYMIRHHEGAILMVADLFSSPRSGQEEEIFQFASHVEGDQNVEIVRMRSMLNAMR